MAELSSAPPARRQVRRTGRRREVTHKVKVTEDQEGRLVGNASTSSTTVRLPNQVPEPSLVVGLRLCEGRRMSLPQRSPRVTQPMLVTFDISCGDDLMPGHTFVARGLADEGRSREDLSSGDQTLHDEWQMVDLVYELVPGVEAAEAPTEKSRPFTVDATYGADVPLSWSTGGAGPDGPGGPCWHENYEGGASTVGGLGPWPVPEGAQHLTFWLHAADDYKCRGVLRVDLGVQTARWDPVETISS